MTGHGLPHRGADQRLVERAYELKPLSLRNTRNAALWIAGLVGFGLVEGLVVWVFKGPVFNLIGLIINIALGVAFLVWTGLPASATAPAWPPAPTGPRTCSPQRR